MDIRDRLSENLPAYMIPSYMMQIEKIPVTVNGKLDKRSLPEINATEKEHTDPKNKTEEKICKLFCEVLNLSNVSVNDNFFEIGGNSIKAIKLLYGFNNIFNTQLNLQKIYINPTVRKMAEYLASQKSKFMTDEKTEENYVFDLKKIKSEYMNTFEKYDNVKADLINQNKKILLTGGTGYFGIHILYYLLVNTNHSVILLVRNHNKENMKIISELWNYYFKSDISQENKQRIIFVYGDVVSQGLGMSVENYNYYAEYIDIIINSAANVKHFGTQSSFDVNIKGVNNIIEFAKFKKCKTINHISTLSVSEGYIIGCPDIVFSEDDADLDQISDSPYINSKREGEKILNEARKENVDVNIFRIGNLQCNSQNGSFQINSENNNFAMMIKTIFELGIYPDDDSEFSYSPVDQTADACVKLISCSYLKNANFHLVSQEHLSFLQIAKLMGEEISLRKVPVEQLYENLINYNGFNKEILMAYNTLMNFEKQNTKVYLLFERTDYILEKLGFKWSKVSDEIIRKYLRSLL